MFPKFLLPSIVFHPRRQNAADNTSPKPIPSDEESNDNQYLTVHMSCLHCSRCAADLCLTSQIISKGFTGRHGRAYLVSGELVARAVSLTESSSPNVSLPNTVLRRPVARQLVTGLHSISDICCAFCDSVLGWKYVSAEEESQRYKVGKFILETRQITKSSTWETPLGTEPSVSLAPQSCAETMPSISEEDDHIEFDSEDEDECEDLFTGVWSPSLALRRRNRKLDRRPSLFGFSP
ncbi:yippee/mis18 family protein [Aspergillus clavatus NRRL 1]|uniref:Yippee putative zinc-binding protein n=1 Tax=Aspergillus clavatus (strain ATCC 1007 / CBS 513.65 / DSM 816 / NCTC 3887 / NRRL 1 / QM 1276 / 107) TaxID=344612 RepID=A1C5W3_ASPCL|nr:Yippee putative zinc-binding protein [Aspergillus clavatus NRRL 1]EAW13784.1 Yippee putative zinc-binding protein [Aspergillus clavatus NRRL 1]